MTNQRKIPRFSAEVRARAVRMVLEHESDYGSQWAAICAIAPKIGCANETLRAWLRQSDGKPAREVAAPPGDEEARIKALEQEVRELRQANEILRKASAYFARAELDRPFKS
jgi:transposase